MLPLPDVRSPELAPAWAGLRPELREAVHRLRQTHRGRSFERVLHVGSLGAEAARFTIADRVDVDQALRLDVATALLERCAEPQPLLWITRPGDPEPWLSDLAWLRAAWLACRDDGRTPGPAIVLTKDGWTAPFTGEQARWKRLRLRTGATHSGQACTGSLECISSR